jgi:hypothetical protein
MTAKELNRRSKRLVHQFMGTPAPDRDSTQFSKALRNLGYRYQLAQIERLQKSLDKRDAERSAARAASQAA